jgi:hypothetical protein
MHWQQRKPNSSSNKANAFRKGNSVGKTKVYVTGKQRAEMQCKTAVKEKQIVYYIMRVYASTPFCAPPYMHALRVFTGGRGGGGEAHAHTG